MNKYGSMGINKIEIKLSYTKTRKRFACLIFTIAIILMTIGFVMVPAINADAECLTTAVAIPKTERIAYKGSAYTLYVYNIDGYSYVKLRDVAYMLKDSLRSFNVEYIPDGNYVSLRSYGSYIPNGTENQENGPEKREAILNNKGLVLDGKFRNIVGYNIKNSNYYRLRDLGCLLDFRVSWEDYYISVSDKGREPVYYNGYESYYPGGDEFLSKWAWNGVPDLGKMYFIEHEYIERSGYCIYRYDSDMIDEAILILYNAQLSHNGFSIIKSEPNMIIYKNERFYLGMFRENGYFNIAIYR